MVRIKRIRIGKRSASTKKFERIKQRRTGGRMA